MIIRQARFWTVNSLIVLLAFGATSRAAGQDLVEPSEEAHVWIETDSVRVETRIVQAGQKLCPEGWGMDVRIFTSDETLFQPDDTKLQNLLTKFTRLALQQCPGMYDPVVRGYLDGQYKFFSYADAKRDGRIWARADIDEEDLARAKAQREQTRQTKDFPPSRRGQGPDEQPGARKEQQQDEQPCGDVPARYQQNKFGRTLFALETACSRAFSPEEQLFVAGLAEVLRNDCGLPGDLESRLKILNFLTSSMWVAVFGPDYSNEDLGASLKKQMSSHVEFTLGAATAKALDCAEPPAARLAQKIVTYLDRTASPDAPGAQFVKQCARYYAGQYSEDQCQCVANVGRAVFPSIHQLTFSPRLIKRITQGNPLVGLQMAVQCGIRDY